MEIRSIDGFLKGTHATKREASSDFVKELESFIHWVNQQQKRSEAVKEAVMRGEDISLHQLVVELEKASVAMNLLIQVRNKLLEAFQELNRMQV
ncbi:MAG: flagellar hook-basal body complex protein FliE [Aquificaceae bacterium]|nr:flagellar hook-basal body complex protein FliE [Aquificaceae bacterium]MDW8423354.1 flagellar hook-basal body complex protein FliE [Aquificaceae bacterium]